jgi:hypothetical protein
VSLGASLAAQLSSSAATPQDRSISRAVLRARAVTLGRGALHYTRGYVSPARHYSVSGSLIAIGDRVSVVIAAAVL